jgi:cell division protease FtsH
MVMTDDEKKMTAYHEAGHAIVSVHEPASDPIHKATIIPRGRALGMVMRLPERDSYSYHRDKMHANLSVSMGGRVAEELIFGYDKVSSGASSPSLARDIQSDEMGPQYEERQDGYLGYGMSQRSAMVDAETQAGGACHRAKPMRLRNPADMKSAGQGYHSQGRPPQGGDVSGDQAALAGV